MSITINLYYTGKGDAARKFAEKMEASGIAETIRNEDGNERYEYFFPMNDPETVNHASKSPLARSFKASVTQEKGQRHGAKGHIKTLTQ